MTEFMPCSRYQLTGERLSPIQRFCAAIRSVGSRALDTVFDNITPKDPLSMRGVVTFFPQDVVWDYLRTTSGDKPHDLVEELRPTTAAPEQLIEGIVKLPEDR